MPTPASFIVMGFDDPPIKVNELATTCSVFLVNVIVFPAVSHLKFQNVVEPEIVVVTEGSLKITVLVPSSKVPPFAKSPLIVKVFTPAVTVPRISR